MKRVMIESPYRATEGRSIADNLSYAEEAMRDSLKRGEAPFAMHLLYPFYLDDRKTDERARGISCGLSWSQAAELVAVYCDFGITHGMIMAIKQAKARGITVELRALHGRVPLAARWMVRRL